MPLVELSPAGPASTDTEALGTEKMNDPRILDRITEWAEKNEDVRAAILVGSHAEKQRRTDEFSDYDVCIFVTDQAKYASDHTWLGEIGEVWLCEKNTGEGEAGVFPVYYRLTIFAPGTRVDFSIHSTDMLRSIVTIAPPPGPNLYTLGYRILVDKDKATEKMAPPFSRPFIYEKPSEDNYRQVAEDFWHEAHNVAKYLARGDLWSAKFRDWQTKELLLPMIEWHAHARHGWEYDTAHLGKRMCSWVDPKIWRLLENAFGHFDAEDSWDALLVTIDIFRKVARETAEMLGYRYLEHEDKHIGTLILSMRKSAQAEPESDDPKPVL